MKQLLLTAILTLLAAQAFAQNSGLEQMNWNNPQVQGMANSLLNPQQSPYVQQQQQQQQQQRQRRIDYRCVQNLRQNGYALELAYAQCSY